MKLSIIVPVYNMNHDGNLTFCLDSLINQTISEYEIIAVDDASADDSYEVLKSYEERYPGKFRAVRHEVNTRQGGAKNDGMKLATGEWIGFIDCDDWVTPDYYERLIRKAEETGADMVGCNYGIVSEHGFKPGTPSQNNTLDQTGELDLERRKKYLLHPGSMVVKVYRHSVIRENNLSFPEGIFYEDNCASRVWGAYFKHFELIDEPLYYYYQHDLSTVHVITEQRCRDRMKAMDLLLEEYKKRGLYDTYRDELECAYTELYFRITLFSYMGGCREKKLSFVRELRNNLLQKFPDFKKNKYYKVPDREEEKMVDLCMRSPAIFYVYHTLLWKYRRLKSKA